MAFIRRALILSLLCLWALPAYGQLRLDGNVYSFLYAWEHPVAERQWDYYQGLVLQVRPSQAAGVALKTNLRLARQGHPAEWTERVFSLYADWLAPNERFQARLGRQFLYRGVVNGSVDGLLLRAEPLRHLDVQAVGGVAVPFSRPFGVEPWADARVLGAYAAYRFDGDTRADLSYIQRHRGGEAVWQQAGATLGGTLVRDLHYFTEVEYNLLASGLQGLRLRLMYQPDRWSISGEYSRQKPHVFEDSFFNVFEVAGYDQLRGAVGYLLGRYHVSAQYLHTLFAAGEVGSEVILTVGRRRWGNVGVIYQTGFGGDNVGLYGNLDLPITEALRFRLRSSYYSYTRRTLSVGEEATALAAGFHLRPVPRLLLQAEVQQMANTFFEGDVRALLRVNYLFGQRRSGFVRTTL